MLPQWQTGIVRRIEQATHNTRRFWIEVPGVPTFEFRPGQFVTLDLPVHEQRNKRWRSYSIASAPDGSNLFELVIVYPGEGTGSKYIFENFTEGTEVQFRGPQGVFVWPDTPAHDLFLICTGTGIAPFRSMMLHLAQAPVAHRNIHLIYGCRSQADLLYAAEMANLAEQIPGFTYHVTLSREAWSGHQGYVHPIYEQLCAERQPATFMICGWRDMIDEAKHRILQMGYDKKDVHIEIYG